MLALVLLCAVACTPGDSQRQRFFAAVNARLEGRPQESHEILIALAHDAPESRAGRRARAVLNGQDPWIPAAMLLGTLFAVADAQSATHLQRASQNAGEEGLRALVHAMQAHHDKHGVYCTTVASCGVPLADTGFVYIIDDQASREQASAENRGMPSLQTRALKLTRMLGLRPHATPTSFRVVAIGNIDDDDALDVYLADTNGVIVHVLAD